MSRGSRPSMLHLQMGQEIIYLIMAIAIIAAIVMAIYIAMLPPPCPWPCREPCREPMICHKPCLLPMVCQMPGLDQPPLITLAEADGYYFGSGSAEIDDTFKQKLLTDIVDQVDALSREYDARVVEVVGHTDEVPLARARSTMDRDLLPFLNGETDTPPSAADNVGLGMARAAAVAQVLDSSDRLRDLVILPLSAGQTTNTDFKLSPGSDPARSVEARRRIEIRLRRFFEPKSP